MLKADLHIHTEYSMDCSTSLEKIIKCCLKLGINCIAIADHGTVEGALKMQGLAPFRVIVAQEILTTNGEIMGMFLKETVPNGFSIEQTISRIKEQGGLVNIPHPFDILRGLKLDGQSFETLADQIDALEVFNSREPLRGPSAKALAFAQKHDIPETAGSDAHTTSEIGHAYIEMPEFNDRDDFLQALRAGKVIGRRTNPLIHLLSIWAKLKSRMRRR